MSDFPNAQWGDKPLPDWRDAPDADDPDDELLAETPPDVIDMLGFDPLDEQDDQGRADLSQPEDMAMEPKSATHSAGGFIRAAGLLLIHHAEDGDRILFVRNADRGTWEFPGGVIEAGETAEDAAVREVREEIGATAHGRPTLMMRDRLTGVDYSTFIATVNNETTPRLSDELTHYQWASPKSPPDPLHPGTRLALNRLGMNELDIARAIAEGRMPSPQVYENIWLYAIRITGTGVSYRGELKEHVFRDPAIWLNNDALDRCNGLSVIWKHPPGLALTTKEFRDRVIGSIMLPYIMQDELWGVAKIHDLDAAEYMLDADLSTSPAVVFRDQTVNEVRELGDGTTLLIEGEPSLLDHIAIVMAGVWDKGGDATGVAIGDPERAIPGRNDAVRHLELGVLNLNLILDRHAR